MAMYDSVHAAMHGDSALSAIDCGAKGAERAAEYCGVVVVEIRSE